MAMQSFPHLWPRGGIPPKITKACYKRSIVRTDLLRPYINFCSVEVIRTDFDKAPRQVSIPMSHHNQPQKSDSISSSLAPVSRFFSCSYYCLFLDQFRQLRQSRSHWTWLNSHTGGAVWTLGCWGGMLGCCVGARMPVWNGWMLGCCVDASISGWDFWMLGWDAKLLGWNMRM